VSYWGTPLNFQVKEQGFMHFYCEKVPVSTGKLGPGSKMHGG